jgi:hypothetical protein
MPSEVRKLVLGKRMAPEGHAQVQQLEHIRNYTFSQQPLQTHDEYVLHIDPATRMARYVPVAIKLALLKKKRMVMLNDEDEAKFQ